MREWRDPHGSSKAVWGKVCGFLLPGFKLMAASRAGHVIIPAKDVVKGTCAELQEIFSVLGFTGLQLFSLELMWVRSCVFKSPANIFFNLISLTNNGF